MYRYYLTQRPPSIGTHPIEYFTEMPEYVIKEEPIKLFLLETMEDGTKRLQTQLTCLRNDGVADFVLLKDGQLQSWKVNRWVNRNIPYVIVTNRQEMQMQQL